MRIILNNYLEKVFVKLLETLKMLVISIITPIIHLNKQRIYVGF